MGHQAATRKGASSHHGGRASSQTKIAAHIGARWVIASTPAAHVSETAGTLTWCSVQVLMRQRHNGSHRRTGGQRGSEHAADRSRTQEYGREKRLEEQDDGGGR